MLKKLSIGISAVLLCMPTHLSAKTSISECITELSWEHSSYKKLFSAYQAIDTALEKDDKQLVKKLATEYQHLYPFTTDKPFSPELFLEGMIKVQFLNEIAEDDKKAVKAMLAEYPDLPKKNYCPEAINPLYFVKTVGMAKLLLDAGFSAEAITLKKSELTPEQKASGNEYYYLSAAEFFKENPSFILDKKEREAVIAFFNQQAEAKALITAGLTIGLITLVTGIALKIWILSKRSK